MAGPHERHNHKLVSLVSQRLGVVIIVLMAKKSTEGGGGGGGKVGLWEEGVAQSQSEERGVGWGGDGEASGNTSKKVPFISFAKIVRSSQTNFQRVQSIHFHRTAILIKYFHRLPN